jgi:hypothetical protein
LAPLKLAKYGNDLMSVLWTAFGQKADIGGQSEIGANDP